jgi:DNA polymerase III epsilon subunit-like protein
MGKNVLNAPGLEKLPVPPAAVPVPENSVPTYRGAVRIWPDLPNQQLNTLAAHNGHGFHHHNAQADGEAAGRKYALRVVAEGGYDAQAFLSVELKRQHRLRCIS